MPFDDIIPGEGLGDYKLGMTLLEVEKLIADFTREQRHDGFVINTEQNKLVLFFDDDELRLNQVLIQNGHQSKVHGKVGLGDTLKDVEKHFGKPVYNERAFEYVVKELPNVIFELSDLTKDAKIAHISTFSTDKL